jgi:hypothetical protein
VKPRDLVTLGCCLAAFAGAAALFMLARSTIAITIAVLLVIAGGFAGSILWSQHGVRAGRLDRMLLLPLEGGVLVIEDSHGLAARYGDRIRSYRQTAWRLRDGARLGRHTGAPEIRLLGATTDIVWCSSRDMPVHARHPVTFAVVHEQRQLVGATGIELKALGERDNPVFDANSCGVHAYARDGRSYLFKPDLQVVEIARSETKPAPTPRAHDDGKLAVTHQLGDSPALRMKLKRSPADDQPEVVTALGPDRDERWSSTFPPVR